jgi:predicted Zn finger-like uncharacterized protein
MKIQCQHCRHEGTVPDEKIPPTGATVICPKCKTKFKITLSPDHSLKADLCCPNCGMNQQASDTCMKCRIIFSQYTANIKPVVKQDSLDEILAKAEQKNIEAKQTELIHHKRIIQVTSDIEKYKLVASNQHAQELIEPAWDALVAVYPEAKEVTRYNDLELLNILAEEWTYTDQQTSLMWVRNGNIAVDQMTWINAMTWVNNLNYGGYNDWRLPTIDELVTFAKRGGDFPSDWYNNNGFRNVRNDNYWSSTVACAVGGLEIANTVFMCISASLSFSSMTDSCYVWPVRKATIVSTPLKLAKSKPLTESTSISPPTQLDDKLEQFLFKEAATWSDPYVWSEFWRQISEDAKKYGMEERIVRRRIGTLWKDIEPNFIEKKQLYDQKQQTVERKRIDAAVYQNKHLAILQQWLDNLPKGSWNYEQWDDFLDSLDQPIDISALENIRDYIYFDVQNGLMWSRNGNIAETSMNWNDAMDWANNLLYGGYCDWRLPTKKELQVLKNLAGVSRPKEFFNSNGFNNVQEYMYWSSNTYDIKDAWYVAMVTRVASNDSTGHMHKGCENYFAWPVRTVK